MKKRISSLICCIFVVMICTVLPCFADTKNIDFIPTWKYEFNGVRGSNNTRYVTVPYTPESGDRNLLTYDFKTQYFPDPDWSYVDVKYQHPDQFGSEFMENAFGWGYYQTLTYDFDLTSYTSGAVSADIAFFSMYGSINSQYPSPTLYVYDKSKKEYINSSELGLGIGYTTFRRDYACKIPTFSIDDNGVVYQLPATEDYTLSVYYFSLIADVFNIDPNYTKFRLVYKPRINFMPEFPYNKTKSQLIDVIGELNVFYANYRIPVYRGKITWAKDVPTATSNAINELNDIASSISGDTAVIVEQNDQIIESVSDGFSAVQGSISSSSSDIQNSIESASDDITSSISHQTEVLTTNITESTDRVVTVMSDAPQDFKDSIQSSIEEAEGWSVEYQSWTEAYENQIDDWSDRVGGELLPSITVVEDFTHSNFWDVTVEPILTNPLVLTMIGSVVTFAILHFILTGKVS